MSYTIEDRVVEMRFNNTQFEDGVKTSLSTLDKLKAALNFDGATKGLESVVNVGKSFSLSGISVSLQSVTSGFSVLEEIAIGALRKIGEQAIEAGEKLIKSMSVDQISAGWQKFANETTSVGTIVGQGYDMSVVEEQLAKLNWYTDETSYNFVDMVSNIGKFTATGQDLEESVTAMMGIANWAAASGQNAGVASRAMYQLAQAMGKGSLRYDDFKSIQNANMDTKEFREQSLLAAEALGKVRKEADGTYTVLASGANFTFAEMFASDALTRQMWYTSDVMMEVFGKYSSAVEDIYNYAEEHGVTASEAIQALSGTLDENALRWFESAQEARTWGDVVDSVNDAVSTKWKNVFKQIFGNYEEAKTVWTWWANELYNVFAEPIEGLVEIFSLWHDVGGAFLNAMAIKELWENLGTAIEIVKLQFLKVFHLDKSAEVWANKLMKLTQRFHEFAESTALSGSEMASLRKTANTVFTILYKVGSIVKAVVVTAFQTLKTVVDAARSAFQRVIPESFLDDLYGFLDSVYAMVDGFKLSDTAVQNLERTFAGLWAVLDLVGQVFFAIWDVFAGPFFGTLGDVGGGILDLTGNLGDFLVRITDIITETGVLQTVLTNVKNALSTLKDSFIDAFGLDTLADDWGTKLNNLADRFDKFASSIQPNTDKLNDLRDVSQKFFDVASSIKDLLETAVIVAFENLKTVVIAARDSFIEVIPTALLDDLRSFVDTLSDIVENLKISDSTASNLKSTFGGLWSVLDLISQALYAMWDVLAKPIIDIVTDILDGIIGITGGLGDFLVSVDEAARKSDFFRSVLQGVVDIFSSFTGGWEALKGAFKNFDFSDIENALTGIGAAFLNIFKVTLENGNLTSSIGVFISNLLNGFGTAMTNVNIWDLIKGGFKFAIVGKALTSALSFVTSMGNAIVNFGKLVEKFPNSVIKILDGLGNSLKNLSLKLKADAIKDIAVAIGILVASIWVLASLDTDSMSQAVVGLISVMGMIIILLNTLNKVDLEGSIASFIALKGLGNAFKSLGVTFLLIAAAIKILTFGDVNMADVQTAAGILTTVVGLLAVVMLLSRAIDGKSVSKIGTTFDKLGLSFILIASAIRILVYGDVNMADVQTAAGILTTVLSVLGVVMLISKALNVGSLLAMGTAFVALSAAMVIMVSAIRLLVAGDISMTKVAIASGILTGVLALMGTVMLLSNALKIGKIMAMSAAFIALSTTVLVIAVAIKMISSIPWQSALASASGLVLVLTSMALAMAILDKFGSGSSVAILLSMSVAVIAIATALALLAVSNAGIEQVFTLAAGLAALVAVGFLVNQLNIGDALMTIGKALMLISSVVLIVGAGVLLFAASMSLLASNSSAIPTIMTNIGQGVIAFGNAIAGNVESLLIFIATMLVVAVTAATVGYAISKVVSAIKVVAEMLEPFLERLATKLPGMKTMLIAGIALLVVGILEFLTSSVDSIVSTVIKLLIIAINSISIAILDNGEQIGEALGNLIYALGALVVELIGGMIASVANNIIPGSGDKIKEALDSAFGSNSNVQQNIKQNNKELRDSVEEDFSQLTSAAQAGLNESEPVDPMPLYEGINSHEALDRANAGGAEVADATVTGYNEEIQEGQVYSLELTTDSAIQESRNAGQQLAETEVDAYNQEVANADIPVVGENHTDDLQARTKTYGETTGEVYRRGVVDGVDGPVAEIEDALGLSEVDVETPAAESGYEYDAYLAQYMSENGYMVTDSANGISLDAAGAFLNPDAFGDSAYGNIGGMITGFNGGSGDLFGYITQLSGDSNNLLDFSSDAQSTGSTDSQAFAVGIASNEGNVTAAARGVSDAAANAFGDSYNSAFNSGSQVSTGFGAGMYSNQSAIYTAADTISTNAANRFSTGNTNAYNAGASLGTQFATGITSKNTLAGLAGTMLASTATSKLNSQQTQGRTSGVTLGNVFAMGLRSMAASSAGSALVVLQSATSKLASGTESAYSSGSTLVDKFTQGIKDGSDYPANQAKKIVNAISEAVKGTWDVGYYAGANFSKGMGNGISDYAYAAANAAANVAARAAKAAKAKLKINSPSKVGIEIGKFFDLGVAYGMANNAGLTEDAAETMSERILDSFNTITSRIADVLDGTMEIDPTIRPVLDLSEIQNGADQLSGILAGTSYAASASLGNIGNGGLMTQLAANLSAISSRGNAGGTNVFNITVNAGDIDDPDELANLVADRIQLQILQKGAAI